MEKEEVALLREDGQEAAGDEEEKKKGPRKIKSVEEEKGPDLDLPRRGSTTEKDLVGFRSVVSTASLVWSHFLSFRQLFALVILAFSLSLFISLQLSLHSPQLKTLEEERAGSPTHSLSSEKMIVPEQQQVVGRSITKNKQRKIKSRKTSLQGAVAGEQNFHGKETNAGEERGSERNEEKNMAFSIEDKNPGKAEQNGEAIGVEQWLEREVTVEGGGKKKRMLSLAEAVERVAFKEGELGDGSEKFLILVTANDGYLDFLLNWFIYVRELGLESRVLILAEDQRSFRDMDRLYPGQVLFLEEEGQEDLGINPLTYETAGYLKMVIRRPHYFSLLLDLGVAFLYSDIDMVWLRDPLHFLVGSRANESMPPYDAVLMHDDKFYQGIAPEDLVARAKKFQKRPHKKRKTALVKTVYVENDVGKLPANSDYFSFLNDPEYGPFPRLMNTDENRIDQFRMCTCFMYMRPTEGAKIIVDSWIREINNTISGSKKPKGGTLNQPCFNHLMVRTTETGTFWNIGILPSHYFPSGNLFFGVHKDTFVPIILSAGIVPIVLHNNYEKGHNPKLAKFIRAGLWKIPSITDDMKVHIAELVSNETVKINDKVVKKELMALLKSLH